MRKAAYGIFGDHLEDQLPNFLRGWSSPNWIPDLGDHPPIPMKASVVPSDNGFGLDDEECLLPAGQASVNEQPKAPVEHI